MASAKTLCARVGAAELVAIGLTAALLPWCDWRAAISIGAVIGALLFVVTFRRLPIWRWGWLALRWAVSGRRRTRHISVPATIGVAFGDQLVGVIVR
jgi:hypothetical protein